MDIFEKFNSKFGKWYEGFFGTDAAELRPRDVLKKITTAMEDNRKEGIDSKVYVPNKYILELALTDPEERDYLLSFLDEEELTAILKRFMTQNGYHTRGPLDFTIQDREPVSDSEPREKLRVQVRFEKGALDAASSTEATESADDDADDLATVAGVYEDDLETVPAAALGGFLIEMPDGKKRHVSLTAPETSIGRSRHVGNAIVLDGDGMVSKRHANVVQAPAGTFTIVDLGSTNGILLNGSRIRGQQVLQDGDVVTIGGSKLTFQGTAAPRPGRAADTGSEKMTRRARLVMTANHAVHVLASETVLGRSVTSDIVLDDASAAMRHARIVSPDISTYYLEDLGSGVGTTVNGRRIAADEQVILRDGDKLTCGSVGFLFQGPGQ